MSCERARIAAVTFDAGGTLLSPNPSVGHWYHYEASHAGLDSPGPAELTARFRLAWKGVHGQTGGFDYRRDSWRRLVDAVFGFKVGERVFGAIWVRFTDPTAWRVDEGALLCLRTLRDAGLRTAVISNWDERLEPLVKALGLGGEFDFVMASGPFGAHKPDRRIFDAAAGRWSIKPQSLLHVGDSWEHDVLGAVGAGWNAAYLGADPSGPEASVCGDWGAVSRWLSLQVSNPQTKCA
jgi:putative hydrolase of the HAD superfamily